MKDLNMYFPDFLEKCIIIFSDTMIGKITFAVKLFADESLTWGNNVIHQSRHTAYGLTKWFII
jgi:hypothetical protein